MEQFVSHIKSTLVRCRFWEHSNALEDLWMLLISVSAFQTICFPSISFLDLNDIRHFPTEDGVSLYTRLGRQINVNMIIPRSRARLESLVYTVRAFFLHLHVHLNVTVNFMPVIRYFSNEMVGTLWRRVIPAKAGRSRLVFDADSMTLDYEGATVKVLKVLHAKREVADFVPLPLMKHYDALDTRYWTVSSCGALLVLCVPEDTHMEKGCEAFASVVCNMDDVGVADTIQRLCGSNSLVHTLTDASIPLRVRSILAKTCIERDGIDDATIRLIARVFGKHEEDTHFYAGAVRVCKLMDSFDGVSKAELSLRLWNATKTLLENPLWKRWVFTSPFVRRCVEKMTAASIGFLCRQHVNFIVPLVAYLHIKIGSWGEADLHKAKVAVRALPSDVDEWTDWPEWADIERESRRMAEASAASAAEGTEPAEAASAEEEEAGAQVASVEEEREGETPKSRVEGELLSTLSWQHPRFEWILIGSSIFLHDESDADFVALCKGVGGLEELAALYESLREESGFVPHYTEINGRDVAILRGKVGDTDVDVQICRHSCQHTQAERCSWEAVQLSRMLLRESAATKERLRWLHAMLSAMQLKGHVRCCLPGVVVSCLAVALAPRSSPRGMAEELRGLLERDAPHLDFGSLHIEAATTRSVPTVPLTVHLFGKNACHRMTAATTRHLLEAVVLACNSPEASVADASLYSEWRRRHMCVALRVRALTDEAMSLTLLHNVKSLDGHPLVDSLFVHADGRLVQVLCTLNSNADLRYGFLETDAIATTEPEYVTVVRRNGRRTCRLCLSYMPPTCELPTKAKSVSDMFSSGNGRSFPNTPDLTEDVLSRFAPEHWVFDASAGSLASR